MLHNRLRKLVYRVVVDSSISGTAKCSRLPPLVFNQHSRKQPARRSPDMRIAEPPTDAPASAVHRALDWLDRQIGLAVRFVAGLLVVGEVCLLSSGVIARYVLPSAHRVVRRDGRRNLSVARHAIELLLNA